MRRVVCSMGARPGRQGGAGGTARAGGSPFEPSTCRSSPDGCGVERKYDELAERFAEREYGDPERYFGRRAAIVATLGPRLRRGDRVLDLACADGSFAPPLLALGLAYTGADLSGRMIEVARRRHGRRADFELADILSYRPRQPVQAVVCFRSLHFVDDRVAFFRHVGSFAERKLLFDHNPRREPLAAVAADLRAAGFPHVAARPFFVPQHARLPAAVAAALAAAERTPGLAALVLRLRFSLIVCGYRE